MHIHNSAMKRLFSKLFAVLGLALALSTQAQASDYGCKALFCLANPKALQPYLNACTGPVFTSDEYLAQRVGEKSAVFHRNDQVDI